MGQLSGIARHVAAALQDPTVRREVALIMKQSPDAAGLDLQGCQEGSTVGRMLAAGELRGAGSAQAVCQQLMHAQGMVLFMDRTQLAAWDPSVVPIVTAVESPGRFAASTVFQGYRSPTRMITLNAAHPNVGPVLVVFPHVHPSRAHSDPTHTHIETIAHSDTGARR
ncbi:MAG: hypothetical protein ABI229_02875 [Gemmatimonadaceae bacterium]